MINGESVKNSSENSYVWTPGESGTYEISVVVTDSEGNICTSSKSFTIGSVSQDYEIGDVNLDGYVNINDATIIQKYSIELCELNETQIKLADINSDSVVNVSDATCIQKKINGLAY